ncbi:MAG TPA: hypothetical protein VF627_12285 [Abditibacterium sp.]|jgi:hypothetical protein
MWILVLTGLFSIGYGFYQLLSDKNALWEGQERRFRAQGIVNRVRTPEWEHAQNVSGTILLVTGVAIIGFGLFISANSPKKSDLSDMRPRYYINGREISEAEAERMGLKAMMDAEPKK